MRLLYLYPEEWTGLKSREVQVLASCAALADSGVDVTLITAGGDEELHDQLLDMAGATEIPGLDLVSLSRKLGPVQSTAIFSRNFNHWMKKRQPFDLACIRHLKAAGVLAQAKIPYAYEAHSIYTAMQSNPSRQRLLHKVEGQVLAGAKLHIATSAPLAVALLTWFNLSKDFTVVPNAGMPPSSSYLGSPDGPFVYCGSIDDASELAAMIQATRDAKLPLKIVGGTDEEWRLLGGEIDTGGIEWQPRVPLSHLPDALAGARAGLIPTNTDAPSGEFSCPLKLFDYARCGLPVLSTMLPSLQNLEVGPWCTQIPSPARLSWVEALQNFRYDAGQAEAARVWSGEHTWGHRAEMLKHALGIS